MIKTVIREGAMSRTYASCWVVLRF